MRPLAAAVLSLAAPALAQEAMYTQAATMPGPGSFILREQLMWSRYGLNPITGDRREDVVELINTANIGLARALSVVLDVPVAFKRTEDAASDSHWDRGVEDLDVMFKYRIHMDNPGGVDTTRIALLGGASFASGDDRDFSSQSINPMLGAVYTQVVGRHGFNQDLLYSFNTGGSEASNTGGEGPADALRFNTAYLYRIAPDRYDSESDGAWYLTAEINGLYETNGDTELRWAPGLMYEGRHFGFELMAQFPLWDDLSRRAELDFSLGLGLRFLF